MRDQDYYLSPAQAQAILDKSLFHLDQTQIGTALQVFYSLGILNQKLVDTLRANEKHFQKLSGDLLNTTNLTLQSTSSSASLHSSVSTASALSSMGGGSAQFPGRTNMPNVGSMGQFRAHLWTNVEKLMDNMYDSCSQIVQLQQILEKKKDLVTNVFYIDEIDFTKIYSGKMYLIAHGQLKDEDMLGAGSGETLNFIVNTYDGLCSIIDTNEINVKKSIEFMYDQWRRLTTLLNAQLLNSSNQSNYIKQTFQNEYPKLLKLQNDLWMRLIQLNPMIDRYRYQVASGQQSEKTPSRTSIYQR